MPNQTTIVVRLGFVYFVSDKQNQINQGQKPYYLVFILGLAKRDLWGLGAESWYVVASCPFAKMIPQWENHFGKRKVCYNAEL